jgi:hypothetical protein
MEQVRIAIDEVYQKVESRVSMRSLLNNLV